MNAAAQGAARRVALLGIRVTAFDLPTAVAEMTRAVEAGRLAYASTCPVYTLMQGHERADVRAALNGADWVTPDGMPVVWALRRLGAAQAGRVYGPDLMLAVSAASAERGLRQYYLGGAPGVAEALAAELTRRFPALVVAGFDSPPFRAQTEAEEAAMLDKIDAARADIVWVGLGSPKQDLWMARCRPRLRAPLLVGVGAAFDFFTGRQAQAPGWVQRSGLEWLFRLLSQPRRLWRRYLIYNPKFVYQFARQLAGVQRYD
jgi:N-acetylglucosaminyldiphosphoundecaprenol N-acetyl-beta-D-mannosaminyltransferase